MKVISQSIIYDNPLPQLRSRQAAFPFLAQLGDGTVICSYQIGEAFESVDGTSYISRSVDGGKTWEGPFQMFDKSGEKIPVTDCCKVTSLGGDRVVGIGYEYDRDHPEWPIGNPETGGLIDDRVYITRSEDGGRTWSAHEEVPNAWGHHTEASAPVTVLKNGDWITPITGFPDWSGKMSSRLCGRLLHSTDEGKTWNDDTVCMEFEGDCVTCYEQRCCELENGAIVVIGWNENVKTGERMNNHYTVSYDGGKTFSKPADTGIRGQASSVCAIGGNKLLALHACRRDTDKPGIYAYIVNLENGKWEIEDELLVWEPATPVVRDKKAAEIFGFLKFGQPGAIVLKNGNVLMSHWFAEQGQYMTMATEIELR